MSEVEFFEDQKLSEKYDDFLKSKEPAKNKALVTWLMVDLVG